MGPSVLTVALAAAAVPPLGLAWALHRRPAAPGTTPYAGLLLLLGLWAALEAVATLAGDPATHRILAGGVASLQVLWSGVWLFFALEYTGRDLRAARRLLLGAAGAAVLTTALLLAAPTTSLLWTDFRLVAVGAAAVADAGFGPWLALVGVLAAGALAAGLALLVEQGAADPGRYGREIGLLSLVAVVPAAGVLRRALEVGPLPAVDVAAMVTAGVLPAVWLGVRRGSLFESGPAARRAGQAAAIDDLGDAVLVLDESDRVVELNESACELFAHVDGGPDGRSLSALAGRPIGLAEGDTTVRLRTPAGRRAFRASVSPLEGARGSAIGRTLVLTDVTDEIHRRQRFEVLNRVLRHNVRNAVNAVAGYAGQLEDAVDDDARWMVERIRRRSADLLALGERAGTIERITAPEADPEPVGVAGALDAVAATLDGGDHSSSIAVSAPRDIVVTTIPSVLEEAVAAAVESLRATGDEPNVRLEASAASGGWVWIRIESDGDPVPAAERAVIEAGEETALTHCRDLDLWLVAWSVETLGGDVAFGESPARIELRLPDLPD